MHVIEEIAQYFVVTVFGFLVGAVVNAVSRYFLSRSSTALQSSSTLKFLRTLIPVTAIKTVNLILGKGLSSTADTKRQLYSDVVVELVCGFGTLELFVNFYPAPVFFTNVAFCAALLAIFRIDLGEMIIPDAISLNSVWVGFMLSWLGVI
ncbi:MAG: hypothetical protein WB554_10480, partial [Desulfomonilaceae bacterium]